MIKLDSERIAMRWMACKTIVFFRAWEKLSYIFYILVIAAAHNVHDASHVVCLKGVFLLCENKSVFDRWRV